MYVNEKDKVLACPSQMDLGYRLTGSGIQGYFPVPVIVEPPFSFYISFFSSKNLLSLI
jgi:hypothetical protein